MTDFNMPPGVSARDIPGQDNPRDDGGAAFPLMPPQDTAAGIAVGYPYPEPGMTLRDYFAAHAMPQLIAAICAGQHTTPRIASTPQEGIAIEAYMLADAMLKARAQ